jgi:ribulose-phosphate 3-epimerase
MAVVCPAILAESLPEYNREMHKVVNFAHRIHIDLTDGIVVPNKTIEPAEAWWPAGVRADFHLMYEDPVSVLNNVLEHKPHMVIVHAEASGSFAEISNRCRAAGVKVGIAIMPKTDPNHIRDVFSHIDHVMIFSGQLGKYGGHANLDFLHKVRTIKSHNPEIEIGWDGGINEMNLAELAFGGVDVFMVGGYIQHAKDPVAAYHRLARIAEETGTT